MRNHKLRHLNNRNKLFKDSRAMSNLKQKECRICGDDAIGCNFGVVSCESCKAFFRRNAKKEINDCQFNKDCIINPRTRRFCQHCRLQKCFLLGMKPEMILNDRDRQIRNENVKTRRKQRDLIRIQGRLKQMHFESKNLDGCSINRRLLDEKDLDIIKKLTDLFDKSSEDVPEVDPGEYLKKQIFLERIKLHSQINFKLVAGIFQSVTHISHIPIDALIKLILTRCILKIFNAYNADTKGWDLGDYKFTCESFKCGIDDSLFNILEGVTRQFHSLVDGDKTTFILFFWNILVATLIENSDYSKGFDETENEFLICLKNYFSYAYDDKKLYRNKFFSAVALIPEFLNAVVELWKFVFSNRSVNTLPDKLKIMFIYFT